MINIINMSKEELIYDMGSDLDPGWYKVIYIPSVVSEKFAHYIGSIIYIDKGIIISFTNNEDGPRIWAKTNGYKLTKVDEVSIAILSKKI